MAEKLNVHMEQPLDLDTPMDQIEMLPGFGAWLTGAYLARMNLEVKDVNNKKALEVKFTHEETRQIGETATLEVAEAKPGDTCSCIYLLDNKVAISQLMKEVGVPVMVKFGLDPKVTGLNGIIKAADGSKVLAVLKRDRPQGKDRDYSRIVALGFA